MKKIDALCLLGMLAFATQQLHASNCEAIKDLKLPDTTITMAAPVTSGDLDARGGKLIVYHGWNDPAISPWNSIAYYQDVQKTMGAEKADSFLRLYMVPGMEHCAGGPCPAAFGQLGIPTSNGPKYGIFNALVGWTEKGAPADTVVTTKIRACGSRRS